MPGASIALGRGAFTGALAAQLGRLSTVTHGTLQPTVQRSAVLLLGAIREQLSKPGTGRVYRRARVKRSGALQKNRRGRTNYITHRASAPGEPPAVDLGELRRSSGMGLVGGVMRVGVTAVYGPYLDRGTWRLKPRPFMEPALAQVREALVLESVRVAIGGLYRGV